MPALRRFNLGIAPLLILGVVSGGVLGAPPNKGLHADGPAATKEAIVNALTRLDSAVVEERSDAQRDLRWLVGRDMKAAEALLTRPDLTPEQVERLTSVGYGVFSTQPRAAMGVRFGLVQGSTQGVAIDGAIAGFDSARVLVPGDVIRSIAGEPVNEQMDARRIIISYDPGDEVPVELMRDGQVRDVRVRLGAFAELRNNQVNVDVASMRLAWETRLARIRQSGTQAALESGVSPQRAATLRAAESQVRAYNRPRPGFQPEQRNETTGDGPAIAVGGGGRGVCLTFNRPFRIRDSVKTIEDANTLSEGDHADRWLEQIRSLNAILRDPTVAPADRRRMEVNQRNNAKALIDLVEKRRIALREQRARPGEAD